MKWHCMHKQYEIKHEIRTKAKSNDFCAIRMIIFTVQNIIRMALHVFADTWCNGEKFAPRSHGVSF